MANGIRVDTSDLRRLADTFASGDTLGADVAVWTARALPAFRWNVIQRATTGPGSRIAGSTAVSGDAVTMGEGVSFSGGATGADLARPFEFGGFGEAITTYTGRRKSSSFPVTRHTQRQLPIPHTSKGKMFYPALGEFTPRLVAGWVYVIKRRFDPVNVAWG